MKKQALFLLCFFVLLRGFAQIPTNGLAACYLFNGNANDASGNGNHGTVHGATLTTDRCNNPNSAYNFNGSSYIKIPYSASLNNHTNELTISFWAYATDNDMSPICKSGWGTNLIDYRIYLGNTGFFSFACNSKDANISYSNTKNQWVQFALVYNNGLAKLYCNGIFIRQQNAVNIGAPTYVLDYNTDLYIGADPHGLIEYMRGKLDDICIYNRALTDNEIFCLYQYQVCPVLDTVTICKGQSVTLLNGKTYSKDTVVRDVMSSSKLCDSLVAWQVIVDEKCAPPCSINAGRDTTICKPGKVLLKGVDSTNSYGFYQWMPSKLVADSTKLNTSATVSATTIFTLTGFKEGNNLVVNGNFSSGNTGFSSNYIYCSASNALPEGQYSVVSNARDVHTGFSSVYDHTLGNSLGRFMVVNGSKIANTMVWQQTVTVTPNTDYIFYTWVSTVTPSGNPAQLQFKINGNSLGNVFTAPQSFSDGWKQFYITWHSGGNTTAQISITNQNTDPGGNDFGLDDIYFASVTKCTDTVVVTIEDPVSTIYDTVCQNTAYIKNNFNIPASKLQTAGTFKFSDTILSTTGGCDTVIILSLNVVSKDTTEFNIVICEGNFYTQNGFNCSETGTYIDTLQNHFGCDSIVILHLSVVKPPDTVFISAAICEGETYTKNGFSASKTGIYEQKLQNYAGCDSVTVLDLTVNQTPDIEIVAVTDNFCEKDFIELEIITNGDSSVWNTGSRENTITITKSGTYTATAYLGDCKETASYFVDECPCIIFLQNSFTPNNDGINEIFKPYISCSETLKDYKMFIYNRWGGIVFKSFDYATGWDGTTGNGKDCADGVYFCVIDFTTSKDKHVAKNGSVTVFR